MKKAIILIFAISTMCYGQEQKFLLNVNAGMAMPYGSYANKDFTDVDGSAAKIGYSCELDLNYFFNEHVGLGLAANFISNEIDTGFYKQKLYYQYFHYNYHGVSMNSASWNFINIGIEPVFIIKISNNINFIINPQIGITTAFTPDVKVYQTDDNVIKGQPFGGFEQKTQIVNSVYFKGSLGFNYTLTPFCVINIKISYFGTDLKYSSTSYYHEDRPGNPNFYTDSKTFNYNIPITQFLIEVGVGYKF